MKIQIRSIIDNESCVKYMCAPRIRSIYEKYDSEELYVVLNENISFEELITYLSKNYRNRFLKFKINQTIDGAISLLVNPYFEPLCDYIKDNIKNTKKGFLKFIKKEVFDYFVTDKYKIFAKWIGDNGFNSDLTHIGEGRLVEKSAEMISLICANI
ncbi:MAG: hypothetical protein K2F90_04395 [Clostridiales bacterium]|nr:hypothetical protein [Clostridiales bacterium]